MIYVSVHEKENDQSLPQKLEQAIRLTRMKEYHDDDYDYVVRYPSFFEQTADSLMEKGSSRFCFWQRWQSMPPISMPLSNRKATDASSFQDIFILKRGR